MISVVREANEIVLVTDADVPPGQAVRILRAGVCGTDLQILRGVRADSARILGHEGVGVAPSGELVVFNPVDAQDQDRILGHSYDGIFRTMFPMGASPPELVPVTGDLPLELAAICEPVAAVLYGWELVAAHHPPSSVGIWGAGPIGLMHAREAEKRGLSVWLTHPRRARAAWARERLFGERVSYRTPHVDALPHIDLAFVCTDRAGIDDALGEAIAALTEGGLLVIVGGIPRPYRTRLVPGADLSEPRRANTNGRRCPAGIVEVAAAAGQRFAVTGHRGTSARQILAAHQMLSDDRDFFETLVTHVLDPDAAVDLVNARCAGTESDGAGEEIVKIVIRFGDRDAAR